ncbi:MAG: hypothetical protein ACPGXZ_16435, partial [Saprospiraceae bacterium]
LEVPACIGELVQLEILFLRLNPISRLPIEMKKLKSLKFLALEGEWLEEKEIKRIKEMLPWVEANVITIKY